MKTMFTILLLIILFPLLELWILIEIGKVIGSGATILLVIGTGLLGAFLVRLQGFHLLSEIRRELAQGLLPGDKLFDGLCVLIGGLLLVTPGLVSDLSGFLLLLPFTRNLFKKAAGRYLRSRIERGDFMVRWRR
jgi:UPF0716 protein FxsA